MNLQPNRLISAALTAIAISLASCAPEPPISEEKMTDILAEYYLLNASLRHEKREHKETDPDIYYAALLDSFGVSATLFDSALAFYGARPLEYMKLYETAIKRMEKKLDEINKQLEQ